MGVGLPLAPQAARPNTSTAASTVTRNLRLWKGFFIPGIYPRMLADNGLLPTSLLTGQRSSAPCLEGGRAAPTDSKDFSQHPSFGLSAAERQPELSDPRNVHDEDDKRSDYCGGKKRGFSNSAFDRRSLDQPCRGA